MNLRISFLIAGIIACIGLPAVMLTSCTDNPGTGQVVITRVPSELYTPAQKSVVQQFTRAQLVLIDMDNPGQQEILLTPDFHSACSPHLSYDAKRILFLARQEENDPWQVWEMDLDKGKSKRITDFEENCSGPAYLPGDRLVFSKQLPDALAGSGYALFTMNRDGSDLNRITFQPHNDYASGILQDGRILMLSRQLYPETGDPMFLAMRPNGTKTELFHRGSEGIIPGNRAYESPEGYVYFIERQIKPDQKADLVSLDQDRPLITRVNYTEGIEGDFHSVFPMPSGDLLVSHRPPGKNAGLYRFSPGNRSAGDVIVEYTDYHVLDPVMISAYERPRHLPDEVNKMETTGQLLSQNINLTALQHDNNGTGRVQATHIEVLRMNRSLGIVKAEEDGSVYLKILADTPFRLQTLDQNGQVVNGPSAWLWLRPFERRGCVGCHEDPELVPENLIPLAVKNLPVSIPVSERQETSLSPAVKRNQ